MGADVIAVVGPTATGKSALAVALARALDGEVVSVDSMQIYRGMDVGTAKPTAEEMQGVPHHMIDVAEPWEAYSAARYAREAARCVEDIRARGKWPVLAGGTGLYLDALLTGRTFADAPDPAVRQALRARLEAEGPEALHNALAKIDPAAAARLPVTDTRRVLRALEIYETTGETITEHDRRSLSTPPRYTAARIGLDFADRTALWARIDRRVDEMMARGLPEEVRRLLAAGVPPDCTAMQAIGYKELTAAVQGQAALDEAAATVKLRTRQYAKRQRTWFRKTPETHWIYWSAAPDFSAALRDSTDFLTRAGVR